jgi:hypothetical protein
MTSEAEEKLVHDVLAELIEDTRSSGYLLHLRTTKRIDRGHFPLLLQRLKSYQLVTNLTSDQYIIHLTPLGADIARHPGGYLGYRAEEASKQQQEQSAQLEKDKLERDAALATVSAAKSSASATKAAWVAAILSVLSFGLSVYAVRQSNELDDVKKQLKTLQDQTTPAIKHP